MNLKSFFALLSRRFFPQAIFIGLSMLFLGGNLFQLQAQISKKNAERKKIPYIFLGYQFLGLNALLGNAERIGYITDKNLDDRVVAMEFAQAEFILAPITLDLNNPQHEFLILACTSPEENWKKAKELGLVPLRQSPFGVFLAQNPTARNR